ncbi:hypothetical protein BH24CHL10_BH24CHL10_11060 [soil metagenome]
MLTPRIQASARLRKNQTTRDVVEFVRAEHATWNLT